MVLLRVRRLSVERLWLGPTGWNPFHSVAMEWHSGTGALSGGSRGGCSWRSLRGKCHQGQDRKEIPSESKKSRKDHCWHPSMAERQVPSGRDPMRADQEWFQGTCGSIQKHSLSGHPRCGSCEQQRKHHPVCWSEHRHHYPWKRGPRKNIDPAAIHYDHDHAGLGLLGSPLLCTSHHLVRPWGSLAAGTARKKAFAPGENLWKKWPDRESL